MNNCEWLNWREYDNGSPVKGVVHAIMWCTNTDTRLLTSEQQCHRTLTKTTTELLIEENAIFLFWYLYLTKSVIWSTCLGLLLRLHLIQLMINAQECRVGRTSTYLTLGRKWTRKTRYHQSPKARHNSGSNDHIYQSFIWLFWGVPLVHQPFDVPDCLCAQLWASMIWVLNLL